MNKAAEKYSVDDIIDIFEDTLAYLNQHPDIFLKLDIDIYMTENHGVPGSTRASWINNIHKDNLSIINLWEHINNVIESRLVLREKGIRPNIQAMVLQNKHNYTEKHEQTNKGEATIILNFPKEEKT